MTIFREPPRRTKQFRILLTEQEKAALDAAADRFGITTSDLIREAINEYVTRREKKQQGRMKPA